MRVRGNVAPQQLDIWENPQLSGFAVVTLRENITTFSETDYTGATIEGYEYDEYKINVKYYDNLQHDIEADFDNWLKTGRTLEFDDNSSTARQMIEALNTLGVVTDED